MDQRKNAYIDYVSAGDTHSLYGGTDELIEEIDGDGYGRNTQPLLGVHFHPAHTFAVTPSGTDIKSFMDMPDKFMVVGEIDHSRKIKLLIAKKPNHKLTDHELDWYMDEQEDASSQQDINQALLNLGMHTVVVNLSPKGRGYSISESSQAAINTLGPTKLDFT